jgi:large subunit ribosomal protein L25
MKLTISQRASEKKSNTKQLRRQGQIPGVLYGLKSANQNISFPLEEFKAALRGIRQNLLATTIFTLNEGNKTHKALVKEIQYHNATYDILHVDFALISDTAPVTVNVPVQVLGAADCVGVKLGGFVRQPIRSMKVSCLPKHIPQELTIDIQDLDVGGSKRLSDLKIPEHVKPLAKMHEVAVVVAKKAG